MTTNLNHHKTRKLLEKLMVNDFKKFNLIKPEIDSVNFIIKKNHCFLYNLYSKLLKLALRNSC